MWPKILGKWPCKRAAQAKILQKNWHVFFPTGGTKSQNKYKIGPPRKSTSRKNAPTLFKMFQWAWRDGQRMYVKGSWSKFFKNRFFSALSHLRGPRSFSGIFSYSPPIFGALGANFFITPLFNFFPTPKYSIPHIHFDNSLSIPSTRLFGSFIRVFS